jgi:Selenocysteine lyase
MGEAVKFLNTIGMEKIHRHEQMLTERLQTGLDEISDVRYISEGSGVITFWIDGMDPHQAAMMLDRENIAVRSGEHCVHSWFGEEDVAPGIRASLHLYNNEDDVDTLLEQVKKIAYVA